jgi:predicted acylesterase/phospholipase RssA
MSQVKIGLALGGGGARGLAHIGVLRVLEDEGITVGCIAGTSIGALVGGFYAAKGRVEPIESLARSLDWKTLARLLAPGFSISGVVNDERIRRFIADFTGDSMIEDLGLPFSTVAADMETGAERIFSSGLLVNAIMASISIPAVFRPVREGDRFLADGGLANPLPVSVARRLGPYPVVAVNVEQASAEFGKSGSRRVIRAPPGGVPGGAEGDGRHRGDGQGFPAQPREKGRNAEPPSDFHPVRGPHRGQSSDSPAGPMAAGSSAVARCGRDQAFRFSCRGKGDRSGESGGHERNAGNPTPRGKIMPAFRNFSANRMVSNTTGRTL